MRVVAHRGASEEQPEHTLAAYRRAMDLGADGLEADVRLTADGHLVCVHDRTVDRTSDGSGVVSTLELARLEELDFAAQRRQWDIFEEGEVPGRALTGILTLRRLLDAVSDAGRPIELAIETKHPTRYGGLVERALVHRIEQSGSPPTTRIMSFSWLSLRRVRRLAPTLRTVFLLDRLSARSLDGHLPHGVAVAGPSIEVIRANPEVVRRFHRQGYEVHVWTVNDPADVELCAELGVEVVITDRPAAVLRHLGR